MTLLRYFALMLLDAYGNVGIALGLTFAVVILLRPVTNRLLRPKYRVTFWMVTWMAGWGFSFYEVIGFVHVLPVTFRGWITPRFAEDRFYPAYIPRLTQAGEKNVVLPGGTEIPFVLTEETMNLLAAAVLVGFVLTVWWMGREEGKVKRLARQGEPMSEEWHRAHGIDLQSVSVRILDGLPASFVCRVGVGMHNICLQKELPEEQMELVLRHELAHIKGRHVWFKGILVALMAFYWWNPILWVAYRLACRDMELACDEAVLNDLDEKQRRTYAHTLVELGSGQHIWGGLTCFGECDAEIRVRRSVSWKKERRWTKLLAWPALVLAFLFFFTAPNGTAAVREAAWNEYMYSGKFSEEFYRISGGIHDKRNDPDARIAQVYYSTSLMSDRNVLVQTDNGQWHMCKVKWYPEWQGYDVSSHHYVDNAGIYKNFIPLENWNTGG